MTNRTIADFAADAPLSYSEMQALYRAGTLGAALAAMTPAQRIGCAAVNAERTGRTLSAVMDRFDALLPIDPEAEARDELIDSLQMLAEDAARPQDYARAVEDARAGATCVSIADGIWHVQRPGSDWHITTREECDCQSRAGGCRHRALVHGVEFQLRVQEAI